MDLNFSHVLSAISEDSFNEQKEILLCRVNVVYDETLTQKILTTQKIFRT